MIELTVPGFQELAWGHLAPDYNEGLGPLLQVKDYQKIYGAKVKK